MVLRRLASAQNVSSPPVLFLIEAHDLGPARARRSPRSSAVVVGYCARAAWVNIIPANGINEYNAWTWRWE